MSLVNLLSGDFPTGPCVLGLGTFDGVHRGHQALLEAMTDFADERGLPGVIFTFDHSPRCSLNSGDFLGEITTPEEKFNLLLATKVSSVVFRPFDREFAATSAKDFVNRIILEKLQAQTVFVGFNFAFGAGRQGNATMLRELLNAHNRDCLIIPPVTVAGQLVSSTLIRETVARGDMAQARLLLGRNFSFSGVVTHGDHRGRELGFPTANLDLYDSKKVLPPHGVYLGRIDTPYGSFPGLVNIGIRPTFGHEHPLLEAHLIGFSGNLYQCTIRVHFIRYLREEVRFPHRDQLVTQIRRDLEEIRSELNNWQ